MKYQFTADADSKSYDAFVSTHPLSTLLQSYKWSNIKQNWGSVHTAVLDEQGNMAGAALMLIKRLPGGFSMCYIPRGPIMDYHNQELVKFYMDELKKEAKKHKALFIKMDPPVHLNDYASADYNQNWYPEAKEVISNLEKAGCIHQGYTVMIEESIQPRFQSVVYDQENFDDTLPKHTKRLIKDADKRNVQIIHGHKELLDDFSRLVQLTEERKGVALRNRDYFELLLDTYGEDAVIFLAVCDVHQLLKDAKAKMTQLEAEKAATPENAKKKLRRIEDQINSTAKSVKEFQEMADQGIEEGQNAIAGILSVNYGKTCEMLYAGMDERFKQFMPQYKEYVENFKWAFEKGCTMASMGGVEGTLDDGLTKFKDNFAPTINEFIGEFDIPVNKILYAPAKVAYNKMKERING